MKKLTMKTISAFLAAIMAAGVLAGCGQQPAAPEAEAPAAEAEAAVEAEAEAPAEAEGGNEITILYTNDVHTYINNTEEDDAGNVTKLLSYASVAALKKELQEQGKDVILVDAGDHSQGTAYGGLDEGKSIIQIMNAAGYDLATLGNHEFDYGLFRAFAIMDEAQFPYVSCSFYSVEEDKPVLPPYQVLEAGGKKIAFVGISTPETITKSTPSYFMDEKGEKFIYGFRGGDNGQELYDTVQAAIDEARTEADYVIALGHLGVDDASKPYTSEEVIANTSGLDAFIDGHSHTSVDRQEVQDKDGNTVVLTQSGNYLSAIGQMTISADGTITTQLISEYEGVDEEVAALADKWIADVDTQLGDTIAVLDSTLYIMDPENPELRRVRSQETNLGDLNADAYYYYFNEELELDCDVAIANGGGIRANVDPGEVSYMTAKTVNPFGNVACLVEVTGQTLLDALEMGVGKIGLIDEETGNPAESGGFLHVAGMSYKIHSDIESTVQKDEDGIWTGSPTGDYKVYDVKIYNKETGKYEDLDLNAKYSLAGINYILRNMGDGMNMFSESVSILDYVDEDYRILSAYLKAFATGDDGMPHISTKNSPLSAYDGYLINYEEPFGAGRIIIDK